MKKYYLLLLVICKLNIFAQNKLSFSDENGSQLRYNLSLNFKDYKLLNIEDDLQKISEGVTITIDYGKQYKYSLKESKLLSNDYSITIKDGEKLQRKSIADLLNISYKSEINSVSFYNVLGQEIMTKTINANTSIVDTASSSSATYFLKIVSGDSYAMHKIIKE